MQIQRENLIEALRIAIVVQSSHDEQQGFFTKSAKVAGWEIILTALQSGQQLDIRSQ